jgi:hypothetical protein
MLKHADSKPTGTVRSSTHSLELVCANWRDHKGCRQQLKAIHSGCQRGYYVTYSMSEGSFATKMWSTRIKGSDIEIGNWIRQFDV